MTAAVVVWLAIFMNCVLYEYVRSSQSTFTDRIALGLWAEQETLRARETG